MCNSLESVKRDEDGGIIPDQRRQICSAFSSFVLDEWNIARELPGAFSKTALVANVNVTYEQHRGGFPRPSTPLSEHGILRKTGLSGAE